VSFTRTLPLDGSRLGIILMVSLQSVMDNVIATREVQVERKHFYIEFRENERGRFMRITEEAHGRRNTIIIPSTGLEEFMTRVDEVIQLADRVPATS